MFALPGLCALLAFIYLRPQELIPQLASLPLLYLLLGLAVFGYAVDVKLRRARLELHPLDGWALAFYAWCLIGLAVKNPNHAAQCAITVGFDVALCLLIAHSVQTFRALQVVAATLLACALFIAAIGVHQGLAPHGCHRIVSATDFSIVYDGRPCETPADCHHNDPEPGAEYRCERVGLLDTSTIGDRIRWRGLLNDPNDLALGLGVALPFAFAFFERRRSAARLALVVVALGLIGGCTIFSHSRGGQLVYLVVLGAYFVKRFGWRGLIAAGIFALPIVLLGGRSGDEAESSSLERLECWYEGMSMVRAYPLIGVGEAQFVEHHYLTAHNAYILAAAELGLPGFLIWSALLYIAGKSVLTALWRLGALGEAPQAARTWAMAIAASLAGMLCGIFFLSFTYHPVLWTLIGLGGALATAMRSHDREWRIGFSVRDLRLLLILDGALLAGLFLYTRIMGSP